MTPFASPVNAQGIDLRTAFAPARIFDSLGNLLTFIINFALGAAGVVFFFLLIWGGIRFMTSRGDDKALGEARQTITNAGIGLLIILAAFIIIQIVFRLANYTGTRLPF
ncbi:MAG: hypothetical protein Q8P13_00510 [bacterium]|nr:hypothetical protein [bacterium]